MSGYYNRNNRGITKKLGPVTAYADAVLAGYTGTREQWAQDMAKLGQNVTQVAQNTKLTTELAEQTRVNTEQVAKDTADVRRLAEKTSDYAVQVASNTAESNRLAEETKQAAAQAKVDAEYAGAAADNFRVDTTLSEEGKAAEAKTTGEKFAQLSEDIEHIITVERSRNLIDANNAVVGFVGQNGTVSTQAVYAEYRTTDFIELESGKDYVYTLYYDGGGIFTPISAERKVVLLYDAEKNPVSTSYINVTNVDFVTFNSESYRYARISYSSGRYPMLEIGNKPTEYVSFYEEYKVVMTLGEIPIEQITKLLTPHSIENISKQSKNLINPDGITATLIDSNAGTVASNGTYSTCDYIPIKAGQSITFSPNVRIFIAYDLNKKSIIESFHNALTENYSYTATVDGYVRASTQNIYVDKWQAEYGDEATEYEEYGIFLTIPLGDIPKKQVEEIAETIAEETATDVANKIVDERLSATNNILTGKKWWACGDSFTAWTTETFRTADYPNVTGLLYYKSYPFWVGARTGMEVYNFAVSGQTIATPAVGDFTNAFSQKYTQIPDDVDYITLQFGINDSHHATGSSGTDGEDVTGVIPIGEVTDTTINTFCGAYNVVLENLIRSHPFAKIGILVSNGCDTDEYRTKTIQIAKKWGIPYIDLNGDERTPAMIRSTNPDVSSVVKQIRKETMSADYPNNQHPNVEAHKYMSTFVENFLCSL